VGNLAEEMLLSRHKYYCNAYYSIHDVQHSIKNYKTQLGTHDSTPVILATWESVIRKIEIQGQSRQMVHKTLSPK
jgi:hypothetical protein